jgi:hypothetical protein
MHLETRDVDFLKTLNELRFLSAAQIEQRWYKDRQSDSTRKRLWLFGQADWGCPVSVDSLITLPEPSCALPLHTPWG